MFKGRQFYLAVFLMLAVCPSESSGAHPVPTDGAISRSGMSDDTRQKIRNGRSQLRDRRARRAGHQRLEGTGRFTDSAGAAGRKDFDAAAE